MGVKEETTYCLLVVQGLRFLRLRPQRYLSWLTNCRGLAWDSEPGASFGDERQA